MQKVEIEKCPTITICHGSPLNNKQAMHEGKEETFRALEACDTDIILYGHTHRRREIKFNGKIAYNPGSVGAPLESTGKAQYMILNVEHDKWIIQYQDVDYDIEAAIRVLREEGLDKYAPCWSQITENLLRKGDISHGQVLRRAMELCYQETGACDWPDIPERFMEMSLREHGI